MAPRSLQFQSNGSFVPWLPSQGGSEFGGEHSKLKKLLVEAGLDRAGLKDGLPPGSATPHRGHGERVLLIDEESPVLAAAADVLSPR